MKHYKFVDYATQVYFAFVGLLVLEFHGDRLTAWPRLLLVQGAGLASIHGLILLAARFFTVSSATRRARCPSRRRRG